MIENQFRHLIWIFLLLTLSSCISSLTKEKETAMITFEKLAEMPQGSYDMVSFTDGEYLYGVNGVSEQSSLVDELFRYNLSNNKWETFSTNSMPKQGASGMMVNHTSAIIFNGFVPSKRREGQMKSNMLVEKLNIGTFHAEVIDSNPMPVYKSGMAVSKDKIYVFGGMLDEGIYSNKHFEFSPKTGSWKELSPMPKPLLTAGAYADGRLYVFGGYDGKSHDNIFMYNVKEDRWRQLGKMPEPLHFSTIVVKGTNVFLIGEYFAIFDTTTRSLNRITVNIPPLHHCSAIIINNKLYVFGGYEIDGSDQKIPNAHLYVADLSVFEGI